MKSKEEYLKEIQEIAKSNGGECLSNHYINTITKLKFRCGEGHVWEAAPRNIKKGTWCPKCYLNKQGHLKEIKEIVRIKGGKCLSNDYINAHTPLEFKCSLGHKWKSKPNAIKTGTWCPICSQGISERICRKFFEAIFKGKFPTVKFKWLLNLDGNTMHLDGYNENLRIAFEYHGMQHFKFKSHWYRTKEKFEQRKKNDQIKRDLCRKHEIILIEIPYTVKFENMEKFIREKAEKIGVKVPKKKDKIDWKKFDIYLPNKLDELQEIAQRKGGILVSKYYYNNRTKLIFRCLNGHEWKATPYRIKEGTWCPLCYKEELKHLRELKENNLKEIIESKGGKIISKYINKRTKIKLQCSLGHIWEALPLSIKSGSWCPTCHHNKDFYLNEIKEIARERNGECLSEEYINNKTKMRFRCARGHEWMANPKSIKEGTWCPFCYRNG